MKLDEILSKYTLKPVIEGVPLSEEDQLKAVHQFYLSTRIMSKAAGAETELEYINLMVGSIYSFIQHQTGDDLNQKHYYIEYVIEFMKKLQEKTPRIAKS